MLRCLESLSPAQQVIKIVNEELTTLMGGSRPERLTISPNPPTVVMMVGLQGAGKTTNGAKLAALLQQAAAAPTACSLPVTCTVRRLSNSSRLSAEQLRYSRFRRMGQGDPVEIAKARRRLTQRKTRYDLVLLDTAGRLHIDEALMDELKNIKATVKPAEIMLVVDAMTGQDAVNGRFCI